MKNSFHEVHHLRRKIAFCFSFPCASLVLLPNETRNTHQVCHQVNFKPEHYGQRILSVLNSNDMTKIEDSNFEALCGEPLWWLSKTNAFLRSLSLRIGDFDRKAVVEIACSSKAKLKLFPTKPILFSSNSFLRFFPFKF